MSFVGNAVKSVGNAIGGLLGADSGGGGGGGGAPAAPDYAGAARATAQGNLEAARAAAAANRVNQITPYGSLMYTQSGTDPFGNPLWTATQTLSPDQQELYNYDIATSKGLGQLSQTGLNYVQNMMQTPFSTANLPQLTGQLSPAQLQQISGGPQLGQLGSAEAQLRAGQSPNLQTSLGQNVGMQGWDRASNLLISRLEPQLERQQSRLDAQLAAQGIPVGSEAYTRAKQDLAQQQNDARIQAQLQAQGIQQNLFGQELAAGQFGNQALLGQNQAQLANLGFTNQATQQDFANRMAGLGFNNQQIQQMYQNQVAQQQANNAIAQQQFANQLAGANLGNVARQQGFQEQAYLRNEPLNTLNAVRSGAQVTGPSFVNVPQQATTAGADLLGAAGLQGQYNLGQYNAQQAAQSGLTGGLFNLAGAALMSPKGTFSGPSGLFSQVGNIFSDPRLKENIKAIGVMPNGLTL